MERNSKSVGAKCEEEKVVDFMIIKYQELT